MSKVRLAAASWSALRGGARGACRGAPAQAAARRAAASAAAPQRFSDPWWRTYDTPTDGYVDSKGFMNRLPLRLQGEHIVLYGLVDVSKMWADFDDEEFTPILVGGKAVVNIWMNNFLDTDCGGAYLETWHNTFVTKKDNPVTLPYDSPFSCIIQHERAQSFLMRVICSDAPGNPGAATKATTAGREVFGFPKHPTLGRIMHSYKETDGKRVGWLFDAFHCGKRVVQVRCQLPEEDPNHVSVPVDMVLPPDYVISSPKNGGTHKGHNGAHQQFFSQAIGATQNVSVWNPETDYIAIGDDPHYGAPLSSWDFSPVLKVHMPNFKTAAFKPSGWISGSKAAEAVKEHERRHAAGVALGAL